jgi:hypothetical protein
MIGPVDRKTLQVLRRFHIFPKRGGEAETGDVIIVRRQFIPRRPRTKREIVRTPTKHGRRRPKNGKTVSFGS